MSLSDTAEYWWDVKQHQDRIRPVYTHVEGFVCGHYHLKESSNLGKVDCHACIKHIESIPEMFEERKRMLEQEQLKLEKKRKKKLESYKKALREKYPSHPDCPLCGTKMTERRSKYGTFWGCFRYPKCKGTRKI